MALTPGQRATAWSFFVMATLFVIQTLSDPMQAVVATDPALASALACFVQVARDCRIAPDLTPDPGRTATLPVDARSASDRGLEAAVPARTSLGRKPIEATQQLLSQASAAARGRA